MTEIDRASAETLARSLEEAAKAIQQFGVALATAIQPMLDALHPMLEALDPGLAAQRRREATLRQRRRHVARLLGYDCEATDVPEWVLQVWDDHASTFGTGNGRGPGWVDRAC